MLFCSSLLLCSLWPASLLRIPYLGRRPKAQTDKYALVVKHIKIRATSRSRGRVGLSLVPSEGAGLITGQPCFAAP